MNTAYIHDSFVSQNAFIFHDNEMFFYMYQANDKTIIRHAKNLNMFKEQLSYLEEAEKRGQKSELFNLPVNKMIAKS